MVNADLTTKVSSDSSRLSDFSFGFPASDERPLHDEVNDEETPPKPQRKRARRSTAGDVLAAFVLLGATVLGTLGVNQEVVRHYFPQAAAALHLAAPSQNAPLPTGVNAQIKVWVDLKTGLYYCPGANAYGRTRTGRYLKQAEARLGNFEPAERKECTTQPSAMLVGEGLAHR